VYIYTYNGTTWGSEQKILATDTESYDEFGRSVSMSGEYAIAGGGGAAYIYTRNPSTGVWGSEQRIQATDTQQNDYFGTSVSIDGDYAIVGAFYKNTGTGAAYIFKRDTGTGTWAQQTKLTANDIQAGDRFGVSVSISGDYAIVGAQWEDTGGAANAGAAYIYKRTGTTWSEIKKLTADNRQQSDEFGYSVSISGNYAIVGALFEDTSGDNAGAAYIYEAPNLIPNLTQDNYNKLTLNSLTDVQRSRLTLNSNTYTANGPVSKFFVNEPGTYEVSASGSDAYAIVKKTVSAPITLIEADIAWNDYTQMDTTEQKITASDAQASALFGWSVSISGDYAIVGSHYEDTGGTNAGAAYIYKRDASTGVWGSEQKIKASDKEQSDQFGYSVSISGDYAIVGAFLEDTGGANAGAAYIYKRDATTGVWGSEQKIQAGDKQTTDRFGISVSISGDYAIVGAYREDTGGTDAGAAYIFKRDPSTGTWTQQQKIQASDKQAGDEYGRSVSISGDYAIVGSHYEDTGATNAGAAYIYKRDPSTGQWGSEQKIQASDKQQDDTFGYSVSISGDYAIVGALGEDTGGSAAGAAYIYKRDASTGQWGNEQKIQAGDRQAQDEFGISVSISGDYAIVGAYYEDEGGTDAGAAYVFKRDGTTWSEIKKLTASDAQQNDQFGWSVAIDGTCAIVGVLLEDTGATDAGAAYIYKAPVIPSPKLTYDTYNKLTLRNVLTSYSSTLRYEYDVSTFLNVSLLYVSYNKMTGSGTPSV
jgi:hypothetical protein